MSEITFESVTIRNFMSFGNTPTTIDLNSGQTFGIIGDNRDIGATGGSRNGAGKSQALISIVYAAFGRSIDSIKSDQLINLVNKNKMVVELTFKKNDTRYTVSRGRKPNYLSLTAEVDGEIIDLTRDSMANTDKDIVSILGMTFDIFMSTVFLSPHRESFHEMGSPAQRSTIEQMLSLDILSERAETVKSIRADIAVDIRVSEREIELRETQQEQWEARLKRLENSSSEWDSDRKKDQMEIEQNISEIVSLPMEEIEQTFVDLAHQEDKLRDIEETRNMLDDKVSSMKQHNRHHHQITDDIDALKVQEKADTEAHNKELSRIVASLEELGDVSDFAAWIESHGEYTELKREEKALSTELTHLKTSLNTYIQDESRYTDEADAIRDGTCHVCGGHYEDERKLAKIEKDLVKIVEDIASTQMSLKKGEQRLVELTGQLKETDPTVTQLTKEDLEGLREAIADERDLQQRKKHLETRTMRDYTNDIKKLVERLDDLGEVYPDDVIQETVESVEDIEEESTTLCGQILSLRDKLKDWNLISLGEFNLIKQNLKTLEVDLERVKKDVNPFLPELGQHKKEKPESLEVMKLSLEAMNNKVTHCNYLIKLLTDSKSFIRRGILERYIPYLNKMINMYLQSLGLSHVVEVTTDLNVEIAYMQRDVSYYNLSRGERLRLNIATTLAFRDLMRMVGKSSNLLLLDEVLDSGLDESGIIAASELLQKSANDVLLISHRDDLLTTLDNKITVIKENGFSRVVYSKTM